MQPAVVYAVGLYFLSRALVGEPQISLRELLAALEQGARGAVGVAVACAGAGIIVGTVTLTGLGLKLATGLVDLSGGNLLLTLMFTMVTSIILGMGAPTTANYIITSTIAAPALMKLGVIRWRPTCSRSTSGSWLTSPRRWPCSLRRSRNSQGRSVQDGRERDQAGHRSLPGAVFLRIQPRPAHDQPGASHGQDRRRRPSRNDRRGRSGGRLVRTYSPWWERILFLVGACCL